MSERPTIERVQDRARHRWVGKLLLMLGSGLLILELGYVAFVEYQRNAIGDIVVSEPIIPDVGVAQTTTATPQPQKPNEPNILAVLPTPSSVNSPKSLAIPAEDTTASMTRTIERVSTESSYKKDWDETAGEDTPNDRALLSSFRAIDNTPPDHNHSPPTRIRIPAINLDAQIRGLKILDLGNEKAYETPKNVVGHIPESASAGSVGNVWLFGHLESLILGEGSVFRNLPKIHDLLEDEQVVYTILDSDSGIYLYQVHKFEKIPMDDLSLWESDQAIVTMVTCWPRLKYDERILVTAKLVGLSDGIEE